MHWFGGSIAEAVTLSKQKNAIFVVFVEGDNELSAEMTAVLDDKDVLQRLSNESNFLAIKLQSGSINYTHFAKIYQFVPVPSLFFIGRNGTPLEVVCAGVEASNLATRIDRILDEHNKNKPISMQPSTSGSNVKEQTANLLQAEANTSGTPIAPVAPTVAPVIVPPVTPTITDQAKPQSEAANTSVAPIAPVAPTVALVIVPPVTPTITEQAKPQSEAVPLSPTSPAPVAPMTPAAPMNEVTPALVAKHSAPQSEQESSSGPAAKIPKLDGEYEVVCDGDVCVRRPRGDAGPSKPPDAQVATKTEDATSTISAEEKMERAKELIEAKRREKAEKDKQLEKEKEKERRSLGQGVAELKRWQAEQEMKQIQEERKREKMENDLVRQRILEQIALDRAERRARTTRDTPPAAPVAAPPSATSGDGSARARIQFKLPDGSSHTAHFDAEDNLGVVTRYVGDNLQLSASQFSLWTAFPRRELTEHAESLRQLQLAPSAALIVLPRATAVATPGAVAGIFAFLTQLFTSMILEPSQQLYNWIVSRISPPQNPPPRSGTPLGTGTQGSQAAGTLNPGPRRRGNVHRLTGDLPDDDNNTWNGNSTQQM